MRWLMVLALSIMSGLFLVKGIELWTLPGHIDGEGIGIKFLGFSINDWVIEESIPGYALGFTISSLIPILVAANLLLKKKKSPNNLR